MPAPAKSARHTGMNAAAASLVLLMHRYLGGLMDPFVTLLEVHKLMYFMKEAGQFPKLNFQKGIYGPYSTNLRHVLKDIEGHLVSGYADGGDAPDKQLELVPGAVQDAEKFLQEEISMRASFDRVDDLVEGFETPFGLELLATVHWVVRHDNAASAEDAVAKVHEWNERKKRFSPRQIGIAFDTLRAKGWLAAA